MITEDIRSKVLEEYEKGTPISHLATKFGVSVSSVRRIIGGLTDGQDEIVEKKNEMVSEQLDKENSNPTASLVFRELQVGKSLVDIVVNHKISPKVVQDYFLEYQKMQGITVSTIDEIQKIKKNVRTLITYNLYGLLLKSDWFCRDCSIFTSSGESPDKCEGCGGTDIITK